MPFLYKYYGNIEYALDAISNRRLYFSLQSEFNDPFDCLPKFSFLSCKNDGIEHWKEHLSILARFEKPDIGDDELRIKIENIMGDRKHPSIEWLKKCDAECQINFTKILGDIRICCFTSCPRNQMMWAHYANNHQGIVLQFRKNYMADAGTGNFNDYPVNYYQKAINLKQYNSVFTKGLINPIEFAKFMYCSKSSEWNGEDEIRFFSNQEYVQFPESGLTGILVGSKSPTNRLDLILKSISSWNNKPKIFCENLEESKHKMIFNSIKA